MPRLVALCIFCVFVVSGRAQTILNCGAVSVPPLVLGEGIAERMGDIIFNCSGGAPGARITGNLSIFLSVNITNRVSSTGAANVILTVDNGSGPLVANVPGTITGPSSLVFNGLSFMLSNTGTANLRLANLRGAANQLGLVPMSPINAFPALNAGNLVSLTNTELPVAYVLRGLYAGFSSKIICGPRGSPLPDDTTTLASLVNSNAIFNTTRITEGFADAFNSRTAWQSLNADSGTRIIVHYTGFPAGAQLFVPDVVAGSDAIKPTAGGDFGLPPSGGVYAPTDKGSLLLARVYYADPTGAVGTPAYTPGPPDSGSVTFGAMGMVNLDSKGSGFVVYEVVDSNPSLQESAQFPTFLGLAPFSGSAVQTSEDVSLAPVSTLAAASTSAPIPRFQAFAVPPDCTIIGDCGANYFPNLIVYATPPLDFAAQVGSPYQVGYVEVNNQGGGLMRWTATITYANGSGWLQLFYSSGVNNATIRVDATPGTLQPGVYKATLTIDAGPIAGARTIPISLTITPATPPVVTTPAVLSVVNSATFGSTAVAPGSIATLLGSKLAGTNVTVAFDGIAGKVLYDSNTQINVVVPAELGTKTSAQMIISVDGISSPAQTVALAPFGPGIFKGGILNQDNSSNGPTQPAAGGSILQIFATGLSGNGVISARIGDRVISQPYYAGPAPGLLGVQQVDLLLPADLTGSTVNVAVCGAVTSDQVVCSPPMAVALQ